MHKQCIIENCVVLDLEELDKDTIHKWSSDQSDCMRMDLKKTDGELEKSKAGSQDMNV